MIELPNTPGPNAVEPELIDYGFNQKPATGAGALRVDRPGSRFRLEVSFPVMRADTARVFISRLIAAKSEGLRMPYPLLGVNQGNPGSPVVDGSGALGSTLPVRGMTPGYQIKEGFWLTVIDADGVYYLHNVRANTFADASGEATLTIKPILRAPLVDGDTILLGKPMVEGVIEELSSFPLGLADLVDGLSFTLEEQA